MKYIDADKLIAEIERLYAEHSSRYGMDEATVVLDKLEDFITTLQQEQSGGDDGKFVKVLVRKEFAEQFQRLGDELQASQSSFIKAMNQQEQPEVDLEKEIDRYCKPIQYWQVQAAPFTSLEDCARHFYELGLNTRNEEQTMKQKKLYAIKVDSDKIWETELDINEIIEIAHYGAGCEMCTDQITIDLSNGMRLEVDKIIVK